MIKMHLHELQNILQSLLFEAGSQIFTGVSTDTRTLTPGNLYFALKGEQFDGHDYAPMAASKGAAALVLERPQPVDIPQIIVKDTYAALGKLAHAWRQRFNIPVIGITGSNGKTTLKNMLAAILTEAAYPHDILATKGNFNNHIGLPLTLFQLSEKHRYAVLEMGMNHLGEIEYLTQMAKPTVAIITNAAESHLEGVKDVAGVAKAKGEIFQGLQEDGIAILNHDDTYYPYWRNLIGSHQHLSFGIHENADVSASFDKDTTIHTPQGSFTLQLPLLGKHNCMNALAATAGSLALNIDLACIKKGLENVKPEPGRMQQYCLDNGLRVIDDTYNANPFSLQAAVNTLSTLSGTKILVLGDMRELGTKALEYHQHAGETIREAAIDYLFTLGDLSLATSNTFGKNATHFKDKEELISALKPYLKKDAVLLVKGSRGMRMENIIAAIVPNYSTKANH
jgi:UDP-N-acetylmuramoyl-tripeptide--D-alanyl-D-alanine ligase